MSKERVSLADAIKGAVSDLDVCTPRTIETVTREILTMKQSFAENIMGIGERLNEAKGMLNHGEWLDWLENNVQFSERTAQNFMRLANEWTNPQALADLGTTKCVALLSIPKDEREDFIVENDVAEISVRKVEDAVKAYRRRDEPEKNDFGTLDRAIAAKKDDAPDFSPTEHLAEREKENNIFATEIAKIPDVFLRYLRNCKTRRDGIEAIKAEIGGRYSGACGGLVDYEASPKGFTVQRGRRSDITRTWTEVWDALAVLALRLWEPNAETPAAAVSESDTKPTWRTGTPSDGVRFDAVIEIDFEDGNAPARAFAQWFFDHWDAGYGKVTDKVPRWYPLPEE